MAYIVTPVLGMQLADPSTIQAFETTVVNDNFLAIESGFTADRARLTTIESWDAARAGANGTATYKVTNLAALDALSTAEVGDLAWMTTPGTGIDALMWEAFSGSGATIDWRVRDMVVADTKGNLDAFITAVAAISGTDAQFKVGNLAYVTGTRQMYRFTSTAGAIVAHELGGIKPTVFASSGTSAVVNADGSVTLTAITSVTLSGIDATPWGVDDWEVVIEGTSAAGAIQMNLANAGTVDTTSNYDWFGNGENISSTDVSVTSPDTGFWPISNGLTPVEFLAEIRFHNAKSATRKTRGFGRFLMVVTAETAKTQVLATLDFGVAQAADGFRVTFASAFTGTIRARAMG